MASSRHTGSIARRQCIESTCMLSASLGSWPAHCQFGAEWVGQINLKHTPGAPTTATASPSRRSSSTRCSPARQGGSFKSRHQDRPGPRGLEDELRTSSLACTSTRRRRRCEAPHRVAASLPRPPYPRHPLPCRPPARNSAAVTDAAADAASIVASAAASDPSTEAGASG